MCLETLWLRGKREGSLFCRKGASVTDYPKGVQWCLERKAESIGMACGEGGMEGSGPEEDEGARGQN